ncbi:MAG: oligoendopeptidase F [Pseudomonadota bacterium]
MKHLVKAGLLLALCAVFNLAMAQDAGVDEAAEREQIRWDLTDLYESNEAWEAEFESIQKRIKALADLKDGFGKSASKLADSLHSMSAVRKDFFRLFIYASMLNDEDQRVAESQQRLAKVRALSTEFGEVTSWFDPTLIALGEKKLRAYLKKEPRLEPFDLYIDDLFRSTPHLLDEKGEAMLAAAGSLTSSPNEIYELIANADIPWGEIELSDGRKVLLNQSGYTGARSVANRDDRKRVFDQFFSTWKDYEDSLGATLNTEVQANIFQAKARNYDSVLQWQLSQENLPEGVYRMLVKQVNDNLPTLHRYFRLRGRILGIEQMHYYDIYPPLVEMETDFGLEASNKIAMEVLKPLGEEYNEHLATALSSNWAHVYPQPGKRSGAYMNGSAYDVHPYVLLNHNDDYNSLSTHLHEWGHAVHSMLAKRAQPFEKAFYSTFTAEMASTINEILLEEHLIAKAETKEEKLFYLGQALESIRGTFFRQTMFAEFELDIHETAEAGEPLTGAIFSEKYRDLLKRYHGHDNGSLLIEEPYNLEWAYIPHFYYDFYVFQYATSISGAAWFAEKFLAGDEKVRDDFLGVLKAGGSDYAYEILKTAGLDMAGPEPYEAIIRRMEDIMDRIEALLDAE